MNKRKSVVLAMLLMVGISAFGANVWVSPAGSDNNSGSEQSPMKSLPAAMLKARELHGRNDAAVEVILKAGTYLLSEPLLLEPADSYTTIRADKGAKVIVSGGQQVTVWQQVGKYLYKARLDREDKLRTLFVNGKRMRMAGTDVPVNGLGDWGKFEIKGDEPWAFGAGTAIDGIKFSSKDIQPYQNPEDVEMVQFNIWTEKILCARDMEQIGDSTIIKLQQLYGAIATTMAWAGKINYTKSFVIRNAYELLDSPGEFYFNRKTKTLYYYNDGEDMATAEVIAPGSDGLIHIKGESNDERVQDIRFEGITFSYDDWSLMEVAGSHGFAGIQSLGLAVKYIPGGNWHETKYNSTDVPRGAIQVENAENISFIRNRFEHISSGIAINLVNDVKSSTVEGNYFNDLLGNAVNVGHPQHYIIGDGAIYGKGIEGVCENNRIANNYLRNVSVDFRQVEGITSFFVANTEIVHNDIDGTPYGAIVCGWWWGNAGIPPSTVPKNNTISFNKAGNTHKVLDDGGIIYLLGEQPGTVVEGNYLYNGPRCIYPDEGSAYMTITGNVIDNNSYKWMWLHIWNKRCHDIVARKNYVVNNLLVNNGTNNTIEETYSFRDEEFSEDALKIKAKAGIEDAYKDIIPETEPEKIRIHPEGFKERDVFH
ncbi:right-handed parallel beta-helix repeat-containing protein [Mangrovibacterium diazotrophicum]|uniref:GH141-like insertion domain-containing protein n=1 Tax=Mangrovibacterium diazotrophicum TaxID=1261403 RepID=A0A419W4A4_9BACT|nr:hypothetical protein [Mangrovibacterium diazotrophicum]RKD90283.1 hypothetical protein BC643_0620 [Mangrovibacterium diazotrophicum]